MNTLIVIPHHDRPYHLMRCLETIPMKYRVTVCRGGTFAENCNRAVGCLETSPAIDDVDKYIFLNDDTLVHPALLVDLEASKFDITGCPAVNPNGRYATSSVIIEADPVRVTVSTRIEKPSPSRLVIPQGACFAVTREAMFCLGGIFKDKFFDEVYKNGWEDVDFFLRALERDDLTMGFVTSYVRHYEAQSTGRYNHIEENRKRFSSMWPSERLKKVLERRTRDLPASVS